MSNFAYFTAQDVAYVRNSQTSEAKTAIAQKLGFHFRQFPRHSTTFRLAVEIAMLLQKDASDEVRAALADSVAQEQKTPAILATMLATDPSDPVALPLLQHSPRLADAILLPLIQATHAVNRLMAIAERNRLSSPACQALIEKRIDAICLRVVELHMEILDSACYQSLVRDYGDNRVVMLSLRSEAQKKSVKLPTIVDIAVQNVIASQAANEDSKVTPQTETADTETSSNQHATNETGLTRWKYSMQDVYQQPQTDLEHWSTYVEELNREGALQAPTMLLALGMGLLPLFAAGLARHSKLKLEEALHACSGSEQDFREIYQRSHLPSAMYKLCWWTMSAARELLARGVEPCSEEMKKSMARKLAQAEKLKINFARTVGSPVMEVLLEVEG